MKTPLLTGAYQARSVIASAQRCVNLYIEKNPGDEEFPTTHYPTPGLKKLFASGSVWRGLYTASNGKLYGAVDNRMVMINDDYSLVELGWVGPGTDPIKMFDNTEWLIVIRGKTAGYMIELATNVMSAITSDAFYGSSRVEYLDGYFIFNRPETREFYWSLVNQVDFDALDFASKTGSSDLLVAVAITRRNIFLMGKSNTEIWTNTGGANSTFARLDGAYFEFGCHSANSVVTSDGSIYWLSRTKEGLDMVMRTVNYDRERISTFAIETEFQTYERTDDAQGFICQINGHYWYVIAFPTANKTWVFDIATNEWHELESLNPNGSVGRHRSNCYAFWNDMHIVGDYSNGSVYEMRTDTFSEDGRPIQRIRSFPHLADDGNRITYKMFQASMQMGSSTFEQTAELLLRWSDTKGKSWGGHVRQILGERGDYLHDAQFRRLGMGRSRVFEISWSADSNTALNGAYIQVGASAS